MVEVECVVLCSLVHHLVDHVPVRNLIFMIMTSIIIMTITMRYRIMFNLAQLAVVSCSTCPQC